MTTGFFLLIRNFFVLIATLLYFAFKAVTLLPGTVINEIRDGYISDFPVAADYRVKGNVAKGLAKVYSLDKSAPSIDYDVYKTAWNDRYVLVMRKPAKGTNAVGYSEDEPYYIIDAEEKKLYGGYDAAAFREKKEELGIPRSLKLKKVTTFKNEYAYGISDR